MIVIDKSIVLQIISLIFLLCFFLHSRIKQKRWILFTVTLILFVLLVFSVFLDRNYYEVTIDLKAYMGYYGSTVTAHDVFYSKSSWKGDYFFFMMMPIAHLFNLSPSEYISFQTILSVSILFFGYYRFFKNSGSWTILALFFVINTSSFYLTQGNVLRQGMASSLLILALTSASKARFFFYKIVVYFTHSGSVFAFSSFLVPDKKKYRAFIFIFCLILGFFSIHLKILDLLPLPALIEEKIRFYSEFQRASNNSIVKLIILTTFNVLFLLYADVKTLKYKRAYQLFFIFSIFAILLFKMDGIFSRLILFTDIFCPIILIGCIAKIKSNSIKSIATIISILLSIIYSIYVFNHDSILSNIGYEINIF